MAEFLSSLTVKIGAVAALLFLGVLTACTADENGQGGSSPYEADFESARLAAQTDFEQDVLADSEISRMEYQEAVDRYVKCLQDTGLSASAQLQEGGMYQYAITYPTGTTEASPAETDCAEGTTLLIEPLYGAIQTNPENGDFPQLIVDCLIRNEIVEAGYSKADLFDELEANPVFREEDQVAAKCLATPLE